MPSLPSLKPLTKALVPAAEAVIYIPSPLHPVALALAKKTFQKILTPADENALELCDSIILRQGNLTPADLKRATKATCVARTGAGYDSVDRDAATEMNIGVFNLPGMNAETVAELTLGNIITLFRRTKQVDSLLSAQKMVKSIDYLGRSVRGKVVGVVGMGAIARRTAEMMQALFQTEILVYSPTSPTTRWTAADPSGLAPIPHKRFSDLHEFLSQCDVVSLHCPLVDGENGTRNLLSVKEFEVLKTAGRGTIIVNTSRGGVVCEKALAQAIREGAIAGAAIDVWETEPLVDAKLYEQLTTLGAEGYNVICTPHIGSSTEETTIMTCVAAVEGLRDFLDGKGMRNRVI